MARIFVDESKLALEYVPERIPHREEEFRRLVNIFSPTLETPLVSVRSVVIGPPGTGKTMLAKKLGAYLQGLSDDVIFVHVNCRAERTLANVVRNLVRSVSAPLPLRGLSAEELLSALLDFLQSIGKRLFLVLDDADFFLEDSADLLYLFTRVQETLRYPGTVSSLFILHSPHVLLSLDDWTKGALSSEALVLQRYGKDELRDIIAYRAEDAFAPGAVTEGAIDVCAELSAIYGSARYALELLYRAGKIAEARGAFQVLPEHVREARVGLPPSVPFEEIGSLSFHEKMILLAIARLLKSTEKSRTTSGEVEREHQFLCNESFV
ncbi:TPA: AAA family ATPase, partial [Candidatus Micrarchaeota archaeon]|nr:AAA family ATPase [Candidatus Micrarchaeota archaeon]